MAVRGLRTDLDILQSSYRHFPDQGGSDEDEDEEGEDEGPPHFQAVGGRQGTIFCKPSCYDALPVYWRTFSSTLLNLLGFVGAFSMSPNT